MAASRPFRGRRKGRICTPIWASPRAETQERPDPSGFTYLAYFLWVRDRKTKFKIGLDRIDFSMIEDILM